MFIICTLVTCHMILWNSTAGDFFVSKIYLRAQTGNYLGYIYSGFRFSFKFQRKTLSITMFIVDDVNWVVHSLEYGYKT